MSFPCSFICGRNILEQAILDLKYKLRSKDNELESILSRKKEADGLNAVLKHSLEMKKQRIAQVLNEIGEKDGKIDELKESLREVPKLQAEMRKLRELLTQKEREYHELEEKSKDYQDIIQANQKIRRENDQLKGLLEKQSIPHSEVKSEITDEKKLSLVPDQSIVASPSNDTIATNRATNEDRVTETSIVNTIVVPIKEGELNTVPSQNVMKSVASKPLGLSSLKGNKKKIANFIEKNPKSSNKDISKGTGISTSHISDLMKLLESRKIILRDEEGLYELAGV